MIPKTRRQNPCVSVTDENDRFWHIGYVRGILSESGPLQAARQTFDIPSSPERSCLQKGSMQ